MNLIKATFLTLALCFATAAFAQDQPHKQPNPAHQTKELTKKLGLTPDQSSKIEPILADRDQREQALMSSTTADPKSLRQQRRAINMDTEQKLNAILTPTQQQQWATLKAERRSKGALPAGATPPPPAIS